MKILPLINSMKNDMSSSGSRLKIATEDAYKIGTRTAQIYRQSELKKYFNITKCAGSKVIKGTRREEIPYLAGAIGMLIPLPLMSPIMLFLGFLARFSLPETIFDKKTEKLKKQV